MSPDPPELGLHLALGMLGHAGEDVARSVDQAPLAQAGAEHQLHRVDEAGAPIGDEQQRRAQAPPEQAPQGPGPGVGGLGVAGLEAQELGFPGRVEAPATSTGSAGAPGCILKWLPSKNR